MTVKRHSDTPRVMVVPSASVNSAVRSEVSRKRRQMASGSTVKTAPVSQGADGNGPAGPGPRDLAGNMDETHGPSVGGEK